MVATMHKVAAGNGYEYYLRNTAANDTTARGRTSLSEYYAEHGEAPGTWQGSGLAALGLSEGSEVTEDQMRNLFGTGVHPDADLIRERAAAEHRAGGVPPAQAAKLADKAADLGSRYAVYASKSGYRAALTAAYRDYNTEHGECVTAHIPDEIRAQIRTRVATQMFTAEYQRAPLDPRELSGWVAKNSRPDRTAVAGFDFTFSPVKSVSALWAIAGPGLAAQIEAAHRAAIADALSWLEDNALFTRLGRNGVRQVDVQGSITASFDHRDSRAGDPDLHTHVLIANRVRTYDGKWRTIDGTVIHQAVVTVSEIYDTRLEHHLETALGVQFYTRPDRHPDKVRVREIAGVPLPLIARWSRRGAAITDRLDTLTAAWQATFGREPTPDEVHKLAQRATLETRPGKHAPGSRSEQRADWLAQAQELIGGPAGVDAVVQRVVSAAPVVRPVPDRAFITHLADQALAAVSGKRATWRAFNLRAEIERQMRGTVDPEQWSQVAAAVLEQALSPSSAVARGDPDIAAQPDLRAVPAWLRRRDGTPVHTRANAQIYTTESTMAAEAELIALAVEPGGAVLDPATVALAVAAYNAAHPGQTLNAGQVRVIESFATAGMRVHSANAPAGTGKTTAMRVLASAWTDAGGTVLGLAPTAAAASELSESIGARAETVDKLLHVLDGHQPQNVVMSDFPPNLPQWVLDIDIATLVIVDEHVTIPTTKRLKLLRYLTSRNATVRCIGDDRQLSAIDAGGVDADMAHASPHQAPELSEVVRFARRGEALASKRLREGDPTALAWYLDNGRIHAGHRGTVYDDAYRAWAADIAAGADAVMLAPTHDIAAVLNLRARADRLARTALPPGGPFVVLGDGSVASAGDTVRTRRNDPHLRLGEHDWVRNGYTWTLRDVHPDHTVTLARRVHGRDTDTLVHLPAEYVREHLNLGYAATIDSAQGITTDTCHVALTGRESRQQLYVAMTRGRHANHAYIATALTGDEGDIYTLPGHHPRTAVEHLQHVLDRDGTRPSAHTELRDALDPARRIGRAVDTYLDTLGLNAENALGTTQLAAIDRTADRLVPGLTDSPAYPVLRQHLAMLALTGADPVTELRAAVSAHELDTADDPAAVLDWRLDATGRHATGPGPLPWTPGLPAAATATGTEVTAPVQARERIVAELARQITDTAYTWTHATAPDWARPLLGTSPDLLADLAVWRAGLDIPDSDHRPTGPTRPLAAERDYQQLLDRRIAETSDDTDSPQQRWAATVDRIDPRISTDPTWPRIATHLDTAAAAGHDIAHQLTQAGRARPLPDEMPAAALWARLEIDPGEVPAPPSRDDTSEHEQPTTTTEPEPDPMGLAIADAVDAAALGDFTDYEASPFNDSDQFGPYPADPGPNAGHGVDW
ncbi:MobF family relaxase [Nocardia sp. NPDC050697]|uniref:MobF family relaxase n=1 Tax=Nocardia sp. NPDC050697 TaxID=3155158 RepID=UPI0034020C01